MVSKTDVTELLRRLEGRMLKPPLLHGDQEHQAWLTLTIAKMFQEAYDELGELI